MFQKVSRFSLLLLSVFSLSYALPIFFDTITMQERGNPLLFYSPLLEKFIYRESLGGHQFQYRDETGKDYTRVEFEEQLPFLYYKNLEKKKKLPVTVGGKSFDGKSIKAGKQGFEVKSRHIAGNYPQIALYPLFNNDPWVSIMPFPEDVFRFTDSAMEFINADNNSIDTRLTESFTEALREREFVFPATAIGGKTTNLKPFDEGYFVRDSAGVVFHIKRVVNEPVIVKTPIDSSLDVVDIVISENKRKEFYGVVLTREGGIYLIGWGDYHLTKLPVENYNPKTMNLKLLVTPLYKTVIIGDSETVRGTVFSADYKKRGEYTLRRLDKTQGAVRFMRSFLFPFALSLQNSFKGEACLRLYYGGGAAVLGILTALALLFFFPRKKSLEKVGRFDALLVVFGGFYALLSIWIIERERV